MLNKRITDYKIKIVEVYKNYYLLFKTNEWVSEGGREGGSKPRFY